MRIVVSVLLGLLAGGVLSGFFGGVVGAVLGWLVGTISGQANKLKQQDEQLKLISRSIKNLHQANQFESATVAESEEPIEGNSNGMADNRDKTAEVNISMNETVEKESVISQPVIASSLKASASDSDSAYVTGVSTADTEQNQHYETAINRSKSRQEETRPTSEKTKAEAKPQSRTLDIQLPDFLSNLIKKTSVMTKVGVVILFFGVAFLLKYASENVSVSIEVRLLAVVSGGLALFFIGWRLRKSRSGFSVLLQGAAIGILYLVTFAAMKMYSIISPSFGFPLLFVLSLVAALLSVKQDAKSLAIFGTLGGFLSPILASTGSGSHVMLFGYYAILNVGILLIVWFKAWRSLTLMGFAFTFIISTAWGVTQYSTEMFESTEPFLLLYFVFYVAVTMIFALRKQWAHSNVLDGPLVYGTPVIVFALQSVLVEHFEYGLAWSSLAFGLFYLFVVAARWRLFSERSLLLRESFLAIGCIFISLSIPFAFDYDVSALLWALEGIGALWLAVRQKRIWGCILAILAQIGAGVFWLLGSPDIGDQLFFNPAYLTAAGISVVGLFAALVIRLEANNEWTVKFQFEKLSIALLYWALVWWFVSGLWQLEAHIEKRDIIAAALVFISISFFILQKLRKYFDWIELTPVLFSLLPISYLTALIEGYFNSHPFENFGLCAWLITFYSLNWLNCRANLFVGIFKPFEKLWHGATFLLFVYLSSLSFWWVIGERTNNLVLQHIGVGFLLLCIMWLVIIVKDKNRRAELNSLYLETIPGILFLSLSLNFITCCFLVPNIQPIPYFPLLNPLDIWQIAFIGSVAYWWKNHSRETTFIPSVKAGWLILAGLIFIYLNIFLLRTLHVFADIPFSSYSLLNSDLVQTCLSIFWAILGISLFVLAKKFAKKEFWILGVVLFSVVVLKLFLIDLASSGTVERIVSFIAVGLLLLGVGYIKPETALIESNVK